MKFVILFHIYHLHFNTPFLWKMVAMNKKAMIWKIIICWGNNIWPPVVLLLHSKNILPYSYNYTITLKALVRKVIQTLTNEWKIADIQTIAFFPNLLCFLMKNYWRCFQYCFVLSFCFRKEANISPPVSTSKERTHLRLENLQSNCPSIPSTTISGNCSDGSWSKVTWMECEHDFTFQHLQES